MDNFLTNINKATTRIQTKPIKTIYCKCGKILARNPRTNLLQHYNIVGGIYSTDCIETECEEPRPR